MRKNTLLLRLVTLGLVLPLIACGPTVTPASEEAASGSGSGAATATSAPSQGGAEVEPNDEATSATEVSSGTFTGVVDEDDKDWYAFQVPNGHVLRVTFTSGEEAQGMAVTLRGPSRDEIWRKEGLGPGRNESVTRVIGSSTGGRYYLVVDGQGEYTFQLALTTQNDAGSGADAGADAPQAQEIEPGEHTGQVGDFDDKDWYAFQVPNGHVLRVTFTSGEEAQGMAVTLRSPSRDEIWRKEGLGPGEAQSVTRVIGSSTGGRYYLVVDGQEEYVFQLSLTTQNDAGSGADAGADPSASVVLEVGQAYSGLIGDRDEQDWYRFTPAVGQTLEFSTDEGAQGMLVTLRGPSRDEIWRKEGLGAGETRIYEFSEVLGEPYYVEVAYGSGAYTVEIK